MPVLEDYLAQNAPVAVRIYITEIGVSLALKLSYILRHQEGIVSVGALENRQCIVAIALPCIIPPTFEIFGIYPVCLIYRIEAENDTLAYCRPTAQTLFKLLNICIVALRCLFYPYISDYTLGWRYGLYLFNILLRCVIAVSAITLYITIEFRLYLQKSYSLVVYNSMPPISTSLEAYSTR